MVEKRKSRSIPLMEYYEILQLEFLSYYFRYLYYERNIDREKYLDFCKKKKESIDKLALRNCFTSLFSNEQSLHKYLDKFLNETGMPNLTYRDEHQKKHLGYWDKFYFMKPGTIVEYKGEEYEIVANLCKFGEEYDFVVIQDDFEKTYKVSYDEIKVVENKFLNIKI